MTTNIRASKYESIQNHSYLLKNHFIKIHFFDDYDLMNNIS